MATQDISSLIDWNSPVVEFHCKPLIPLPNFDGQPIIDGDNPFDTLEKQIDQNEPFDMILNQSLNSSSEQIELDKTMENDEKLSHNMPKSDESNSVTHIIDVFDRLNLPSNEPVRESPLQNELRYSADVSNMMDVSPIESDTSEVQVLRKRLSTILGKFSNPNDENCQAAVGNPKNSSVPSSLDISCYSSRFSSKENDDIEVTNVSSAINRAFIGKNLISDVDVTFDSPTFNTNNLYEDLSSVSPDWDELVLISSSSDEEPEPLPIKNISSKNSSGLNNKKSTEKVIKKLCPRLPLTSKDPNVRTKRTTTVVKEAGPLKAVIPIENMAKNVNQKIVETPKRRSLIRKPKPDTTSLKLKRRSVPVATSTPVGIHSPSLMNKSKHTTPSKPSTPPNSVLRSCPPSPDSTSARFIPKSVNSKIKICSKKLALNVVSSSTSLNYWQSNKKSSKDVKYSSLNSSARLSMATGVKSCVKNKENLVPFRC